MGSIGKPLLTIAAATGLALAKGVLSKPGMSAYLEYQFKRIFHGWSEGGNCPTEVVLTADRIVSLLRSKGLSPNRIAVDGVPGSGKSTLAAMLARRFTMAAICLDHRNMDQTMSFDKNRAIYEHHRLLRTQDIDDFDVIIYIDEPVAVSRQKVLQRKRGAYLVDIMNYERLQTVGRKAFSVAAGECIAIEGSSAKIKVKPESGFMCRENIEAELLGKGLSSRGLSKEQALFLCVEGKARNGFSAYLNPLAYNNELLVALKQGLLQASNPRRERR